MAGGPARAGSARNLLSQTLTTLATLERDIVLPRRVVFVVLRMVGVLVWLLYSTGIVRAEWQTLEGCRYVANEANDGDSFHVLHDGKEIIIRLYFVDAPETDLSFPERVDEQASAFGVSAEKVLKIGKEAAVTSQKLLEEAPFNVVTRWQDARGRSTLPRYYGFVFVEGTEPGVLADLGAVLLGNGLARLHGVRASPPDAPSLEEMSKIYEGLEREGMALVAQEHAN